MVRYDKKLGVFGIGAAVGIVFVLLWTFPATAQDAAIFQDLLQVRDEVVAKEQAEIEGQSGEPAQSQPAGSWCGHIRRYRRCLYQII